MENNKTYTREQLKEKIRFEGPWVRAYLAEQGYDVETLIKDIRAEIAEEKDLRVLGDKTVRKIGYSECNPDRVKRHSYIKARVL